MKTHIVKRKGHKEQFDERKIFISCFAACRSCQLEDADTERICKAVLRHVKSWIRNKRLVNSTEIADQIRKVLRKYNKEVAFMYETHKDIV
jgi:transcriptional regulator NrdR family protein